MTIEDTIKDRLQVLFRQIDEHRQPGNYRPGFTEDIRREIGVLMVGVAALANAGRISPDEMSACETALGTAHTPTSKE